MKLVLQPLALFALLAFATSCTEPGPKIGIRATSAPNGELRFELANNSGRELEVYASSLPWSNDLPRRLKFSAHEVSVTGLDHFVVGGAAILVHEGAEVISFAPGSSISGEVNPMHRLDDREIKDENDLFLFWTYRLQVCELNQVLIHAGMAQESDDQWLVTAQTTTVYDRLCTQNKGAEAD